MGKDLTSETRSLRLPMVGTLGLALLAVVAVALVFNRADSGAYRDDRLAAGPGDAQPADVTPDPSNPSGTAQAGLPDDGHTGLYVPGELPEGWRVSFTAGSSPFPMTCPCEMQGWRRDDGATISTVLSRDQEPVELPDHPPSMLETRGEELHAMDGGYVSLGDHGNSARWLDGEVTRIVTTNGLPDDAVFEHAARWTGDGPLDPPAGFEPVWHGTMSAIERQTDLLWRIDDGADRSMVVHISPWMFDQPIDLAAMHAVADPVHLPGNGLALVQPPGWDETHLEGLWPGGASVMVGENYGEFNYTGPYLTAEEMLEVAGGFREVSAEEWAAYIEANFDPEPDSSDDVHRVEAQRRALVTARRLADLLDRG